MLRGAAFCYEALIERAQQYHKCVGGHVKVSVETLPTSEVVLNVDFSWEELETARGYTVCDVPKDVLVFYQLTFFP